MKINVVYSVSNTILYNQLVEVSMYSLLKNNIHLDELNIYVFESGIEKSEKIKMQNMVRNFKRNIYFIDVVPMMGEIEKLGVPLYKGSYQLYIKYFIPKYLPKSVDSFLYLDADTIIDKKLDDLIVCYENRSQGSIILAGSGILQGKYREKIGIGYENPSICVGVMFIDRNKWEKENCCEKFLEFIKHNKLENYRQLDEDVFNILFKEEIQVLGLDIIMFPALMKLKPQNILYAYDLTNKSFFGIEKIRRVQNDGAIIYHYIDLLGKPWEKYCVDPLKFKWRQYMSESKMWTIDMYKNKNETISHILGKGCYLFSKRIYTILIKIMQK